MVKLNKVRIRAATFPYLYKSSNTPIRVRSELSTFGSTLIAQQISDALEK